jgi:hypothetical protein
MTLISSIWRDVHASGRFRQSSVFRHVLKVLRIKTSDFTPALNQVPVQIAANGLFEPASLTSTLIDISLVARIASQRSLTARLSWPWAHRLLLQLLALFFTIRLRF